MKRIQHILMSIILIMAFFVPRIFATDAVATDNSSWYASRVGQRLANFDASYYTSSNSFSDGQCTWYCYGRALEKIGADLPCRGNANTWYSNAQNNGWSVGQEVRSNSIACFGNNHVIFVEWVEGNDVYFTEANMSMDGVISSDDGLLKKNTISYLKGRLSGTYQGCIYLSSNDNSGYEIDNRYPTPFYAYTLSVTDKVQCYNSVNGSASSANNVYVDDRCTIQEVYTNGWCKFLCPWPGYDNMATKYAPLSIFISDPNYHHSEHYLLYGTQGYKKSNMAEPFDWMDAKTWALRVSKVNGLTQVIAWKDGVGHFLTWINHTGDYIQGMNVGSDFYAYIINTDQWRRVTHEVGSDGVSNVVLRKEVGGEDQIWKFEYQGGGYYKIVNPSTGEGLEVQAAADHDGANIKTWPWNGSDNDMWMLCGRWNDRVTLEPKHSNRVMDVADNSTAEGANIQLWTYNGTGAQKFTIWTDIKYQIKYDANGGTNAPASSDALPYLTTTNLSTNKPTGKAYTITYNVNGGSLNTTTKTVREEFKNWNTNKDGTGISYNAGAQHTIREPITMYAQWNTAKAGTLATPTRSGYTFKGWYTAASGGVKVNTNSAVTKNMTVYAIWEKGCPGNHSYKYAVSKNPTAAATGVLTGTCSLCDANTTLTLPKLDTANYSYAVTKAATCTADGTGRYTWKTTTYGTYSFDVTIPRLGHNYTAKVTSPTCTAQGYTTHTCTRCADSYKDAYTSPAGHSYAAFVTSPTCTEAGYTTHTCVSCGDNYKDAYVSALGHSFTNYVPDQGKGTKTAKCDRCDERHTITDPDSIFLANVTITKAIPHTTGNIFYWDAVPGGDIYQIYRLRSGETSWTLLKNTRSLGYKDETAVAGLKYYYKIVARNGDVKSDIKTTASVGMVRPGAAVTSLDNVTIYKTIGHSTGNILYWNAVANAKLYQVYRLENGQWVLLKNTGSLGYKDETARSGVKYYYKIVARNGDVKSDIATTSSASATRP